MPAPSAPPVDPRAPRFAAWVTTGVLVVVLISGSALLLAAQAVVFALGAFAGLYFSPYGLLYRVAVAPWLPPSSRREEAAPVRFAQGVGFAFAVVGTAGYALGVPLLGIIATATALAAAFLNAAFGCCLGCEVYLRLPVRWRTGGAREHSASPSTMNDAQPANNTQRGAIA